jgi:hypothetical protein
MKLYRINYTACHANHGQHQEERYVLTDGDVVDAIKAIVVKHGDKVECHINKTDYLASDTSKYGNNLIIDKP